MAKPTQEEITAEIGTLRKQLKTVRARSAFGDDNRAAIDAQIETLHEEYDDNDIEENIAEEQQEAAREALAWVEGDEDLSPSENWASLC